MDKSRNSKELIQPVSYRKEIEQYFSFPLAKKINMYLVESTKLHAIFFQIIFLSFKINSLNGLAGKRERSTL